MASIPKSFGGRPVRAIGIPWYGRQDYRRILEIMADRDVLPPTYDSWRQKADALERDLKRQGVVTVHAVIDPETFPEWCAARGLHVDAQARGEFANAEAYRSVGKTH